MTLHCVYSLDALRRGDVAAAAAAGDAVLLLGAAVCADPEALALPATVALHALGDDVAAHGVSFPANGVTVIDYDGWLALSVEQPRQQVWA